MTFPPWLLYELLDGRHLQQAFARTGMAFES